MENIKKESWKDQSEIFKRFFLSLPKIRKDDSFIRWQAAKLLESHSKGDEIRIEKAIFGCNKLVDKIKEGLENKAKFIEPFIIDRFKVRPSVAINELFEFTAIQYPFSKMGYIEFLQYNFTDFEIETLVLTFSKEKYDKLNERFNIKKKKEINLDIVDKKEDQNTNRKTISDIESKLSFYIDEKSEKYFLNYYKSNRSFRELFDDRTSLIHLILVMKNNGCFKKIERGLDIDLNAKLLCDFFKDVSNFKKAHTKMFTREYVKEPTKEIIDDLTLIFSDLKPK